MSRYKAAMNYKIQENSVVILVLKQNISRIVKSIRILPRILLPKKGALEFSPRC